MAVFTEEVFEVVAKEPALENKGKLEWKSIGWKGEQFWKADISQESSYVVISFSRAGASLGCSAIKISYSTLWIMHFVFWCFLECYLLDLIKIHFSYAKTLKV